MGKRGFMDLMALRRATGIVSRLRLVLVCIVLVISLAGIVALVQTHLISDAHRRLNGLALPLLAQALSGEREVTGLLRVLDNVHTVDSEAELKSLKSKSEQKALRLRKLIEELKTLDAPSEMLENLAKVLDDVLVATDRIITLKSALLNIKSRDRVLLTRLESIKSRSRKTIEEISYRNAEQIESLLEEVRQSPLSSTSHVEQLFSQLLFNALHIHEVSLKLEASIEQIRRLQEIPVADATLLLQANLTNRLYSLSMPLSKIPASAERQEMAGVIKELQDLVAPSNGLFERVESEAALQDQIAAAVEARRGLSARISETTHSLIFRTSMEVDTASAQLRRAVTGLTFVLSAAFFLAILVTAAALYWVVERQINRRMHRLNAEVGATAAGDLDHPITVTGPDELGDMARALGIFKQNAVELRRSNVELEKFAYVAAHDLRSPIRAIHDLATWMEEDPDTRFSAESRAFMALLMARTNRLSQLLDDLLDYSRAGRSDAEPRDVDLRSLVNELIVEADPNQRFHFRCNLPDAPVCMHVMPLSRVIGNLLSNAVKHHDTENGLIEVAITEEGGILKICVSDDGPGIPTKYHARVFDLFQTLRPRDEVEGSGLGLAIVAKLVEQFGGQVDLHSDPDTSRGACFVVTLPTFASSSNSAETTKRIAA